MKKNIKVYFYGWDEKDGSPLDFILFNNPTIKNNYIVSVDKHNPEFVFYFSFFDLENLVNHNDSVKIFITGEPIASDLNFFDYYFGCEPNSKDERICYFPHFLWDCPKLKIPTYEEVRNILKNKTLFCDFIYGHEVKNGFRKKYFDLFNAYKRVEAGGTYLNNQENGVSVHYELNNPTKKALQDKCKFSLCLQWLDYPWFINEKIVHSFNSYQIPIFYGTETIKEIFNPKRFIFIGDYSNETELLEAVKQIDQDDELYLKMIQEPVFNDENYVQNTLNNAINKIDYIFSNKKTLRNVEYGPSIYLSQIKEYEAYKRFYFKPIFKIIRRILKQSRKK